MVLGVYQLGFLAKVCCLPLYKNVGLEKDTNKYFSNAGFFRRRIKSTLDIVMSLL
jgi:hypothetical protein